jgi:hypothetical protein
MFKFSVILLLHCIALTCAAYGQEQALPKNDANSVGVITYGQPVRTIWEFGLQINAVDQAAGAIATVPVPMDWPEQTVRVMSDEKTKTVGRFRHANPTKETTQLEFRVNRLATDEPTVAYQRFEIQRRPILKPDNPHALKIAAPVTGRAKRFLKPSPYIESTDPRIKAIAKTLKSKHGEGPAWDWVESIYRYVRENVEYEFDEQIHSCLEALDSGKGDCEELSSLFIAICRASKIPARAVWIPGHTYPEFYLVDEAGNGHWIPCQAAGVYEFGEMNETRPVLQKGDRFRLPGQRKHVRYLKPTLQAKDPGGGISIQWISREINDAGVELKHSPDANSESHSTPTPSQAPTSNSSTEPKP